MAKHASPTVIITGASGFLGSHLVDYFSRNGWRVIGLVRNPAKLPKRSNVTCAQYDLAQPFDDSIFKDADYLVHTVKYDTMAPDALEVNVQGAERLVAASRKHKLKKNVFMSTMSAHSDAISAYGKQKLAVEKLFNTTHDVILRSGLIVGNGGIVKQMADFMQRRHLVPLIGGGNQPLQIVAIDDLVHIIERALTQPRLSGTFVTGTPKVYSYRSFYAAIAKELGINVLYVPVPFWMLLTGFRTAHLLHVPLSMNEDNLLGLKMLRSADSTPDLERLGITLRSLEDALHVANLKLA